MSSSFGQEMLGRTVQDKKGKELGKLTDLVVDVSNGGISELLVKCSENIDTSRLPFQMKEGSYHRQFERILTVLNRFYQE